MPLDPFDKLVCERRNGLTTPFQNRSRLLVNADEAVKRSVW